MIKEFTIGASHTINLGEYESYKVTAEVTFDVNFNGGVEDVREYAGLRSKAQDALKELLKETYMAQRPQKLRSKDNG